ncbi:hypothetical protein E5D57_003550 [Metarhizium anisopliae]|nr:hypothetical protein E5D57_003550 [Metarhizium anisopliae]
MSLEPGWPAGTEQTPRSFRWLKEENDEGLVRKLFIVAAWGSDADRCKASLVVYFVTDGCVVVKFLPVEISQSSGTVVHGVRMPFLAGLDGRCAEIIGPFGLAF